jgi:predicted permease
MTPAILGKLLVIALLVVFGWVAGRLRWLGESGPAAARLLGNAAFFLFVPALLFRTTARLDIAHLPWRTVLAFFVPVLAMLAGVYLLQRRRRSSAGADAASPSVRAISVTFGNSVQIGIPLAAALFGEAGLAVHIALVSLHALVLLSVLTVLVELDLARAAAIHSTRSLRATLATTVRNTVIHPVVLPVLVGLAWHAAGFSLHPVFDEALQTLAAAVVPVCLVLIGITLAAYGVPRWAQGGRAAIAVSLAKLLLMPALVLVVAHFGFHLVGTPLAVVVMMAALPVGSNALIFAQRYRTLEGEATAAIVLSTFAFAASGSLWLAVLTRFAS